MQQSATESPSPPTRPIGVGYVGGLAGRYVIGQWGSGFVLAAAELPQVSTVDVFCPTLDAGLTTDPVPYPNKVRLRAVYDVTRPGSLLRLLRALRDWKGDLLVFSSNTTSFGDKPASAVLGLMLPFLAKYVGRKPTVVVYHSSVLTSDAELLGYNSLFDRFRGAVAGRLERALFRSVPTFVLLRCFRERLAETAPGARVRVFANEFLEAIPTIRLNRLEASELVPRPKRPPHERPTVLLHGYWGPQKELEGALRVLRDLGRQGVAFRLLLSGAVNPHFPEYRATLERLCVEYGAIISARTGATPEAAIADLMTESDVLLLLYRASGGQSGVLEISSCFELTTVVSDFPEYREKAETKPCVVLVSTETVEERLRALLTGEQSPDASRTPMRDKLTRSARLVAEFLFEAQRVA